MRRTVLFLLAIFSPLAPLRAELPKIALADSCPSAGEIDPYIMMCGQNKYVAIQARFCAQDLVESWNVAAARVLPILQGRGHASNQNISEEDTRKDYQDAIRSISEQIRLMQYYADVIETYPSVMIDVKGSTGDDTSLSCFNDAFHQVQDVLNFIDTEIVRAKKVRGSATALMNLSNSRHQNLNGSLTEGPVEGGRGAGAFSGQPNPASYSTITGEIREAMLSSETANAKIGRSVPSAGPRPFTVKKGQNGERGGILASFTNSSLFDKDNNVMAVGSGPWAGNSGQNTKGKNGKAAASEGSIGSVLWNEGEDNMKLTPEAEQAARAARGGRTKFKVFSLVGPKGTVQGFQEGAKPDESPKPNGTNSAARGPAASNRQSSSIKTFSPGSVAPMEADLFRLVSERYRGTELFRRARKTDVPLDEFTPSLKR